MPARRASRSFRVAAAALAAAPVGFAAGVLLAARQLTTPAGIDGLTILAHGLTGAIVAALLLTTAALALPPKPVRIVTLVFAGASFATLVYMVQDFIVDRVERAQALDAAYQDMRHYELTLWAKSPQREAFSRLQFNSETRRYVADRPGGWRCEGSGTTSQAVFVFEAMQIVEPEARASCDLRASWRTIGGAAGIDKHGCVGYDNALFAAADNMVEATERKASCRRADAQQ